MRLVGMLFALTMLLPTCGSTQAFASTARVLPPKGIGVSEHVVAAYAELIRVALGQAKYRVVGEKKKADLTLKPTITKVGRGFLLALEKSGVKGEEPFQDSFKIASEDELDVGTKRLVTAVLAGESASSAETVDDVTKEEVTEGTARQKTIRRWLVAFGPAKAYGLGSSDLLYNFELAYVWERDHMAPRLYSEVNWAPGSSEMASVHAGLGLDYYLTGSKEAPYIGADAGLGIVHRAHTEATRADGQPMYYSGFNLGLDLGFAIMRTADVSLFVQASYRPVIGGVAGKGAGIYGFDIGILF